jgi:iron complex outermembrane receptor protein
MQKMTRLALASAIAATSTVGLTPVAFGAVAIEEVVVTARKRDEAIQDVPVAITAVTSEVLERSTAGNFEEATRLTPGFSVPQNSSSPLNLALSMRGSVQTDGLVTVDPSVGVYVDGVYIARTYGIGIDLVDLQDVQVLKGPQGTLFGRNSTAGAMLLNSKNPELGQFDGQVSVTGSPDFEKITGIINIPLLDTMALRIALLDSNRDDYIKNKPVGTAAPLKNWETELGGKETQSYRTKFRWQPTDDLDMVLTWDKFSAVDRSTGPQLWRLGSDQPHKEDVTSTNFDNHNASDTETWTFVGTYSADFGEFKFLASDRDWQDMREMDYDGGDAAGQPAPGVFTRHGTWGREAGDQQSFELQFTSSFLDDRIDLVAGALYFKEFAQLYDYSYGYSPFITPPTTNPVGGNYVEQDVESKGLYSQAIWHINDVSNLTIGLRYTADKKDADIYGESATAATWRLPSWDFNAHKHSMFVRGTSTTPGVVGTPVTVLSPSEKWNSTDWMISYDYKILDDVLVYAKVSTGFRSGGFNGRGATLDQQGNPSAPLIYDPEEVLEYEVGFKGDFFDRSLRWNTAIYTNQTDDKQLTTILPAATPGTPPGTSVLNAGKSEVTGLETELTYLISENWSISGSYAYIDSEVTEQSLLSGQKVPKSQLPLAQFIPENQVTLSLNYDQEFESFKLAGTLTYFWIDEVHGDQKSVDKVVQDSRTGFSVANPNGTPTLTREQAKSYVDAVTTDAYGLFNLNLTASPLDDKYSVSLWVKNLLDERKIASTIGFVSANTYQYVRGTYTEPRMFGATVTVNF